MAYLLEEGRDDGSCAVLGEPIFDLVVARVIAARRASRSGKLTLVRDQDTGVELARFQGGMFQSGARMKAVRPDVREAPTDTLTRRKMG